MRKHVALVLGLGIALGAGSALAQDSTRGTRRADDGTGPGYDRTNEKGSKDVTFEVGVLNLSIEEMQKVQQALVARGYPIANIDGKWSSDTKKAVDKLQKHVGIQTSGKVDLATLNALGFGAIVAISPDVRGVEMVRGELGGVTEVPASLPADANVVGFSKNPIGYFVLGVDQLKSIEKRLKSDGYYKSEPKGAFTRELADAIREFQKTKAIRTHALFDLPTLAWFPDAGIKVTVTEKPKSEISEPAWFRTLDRDGMGELQKDPEFKDRDPKKPAPTAPGGVIDRNTPGGGTGHDSHDRP